MPGAQYKQIIKLNKFTINYHTLKLFPYNMDKTF